MAGFVLCGGRSTRMGRDKALLTIEGVPLAARTAHTLGVAGCKPVSLVGRQPALSALGFPVVSEGPVDFHHPLLGVATALKTAITEQVLIAPCDLVGLDPSHIQALIAFGAPCVAGVNGRPHPLLCVLSRGMGARALQCAQASLSARGFVDELPVIHLPNPPITDANCPLDLAR